MPDQQNSKALEETLSFKEKLFMSAVFCATISFPLIVHLLNQA